MDGPNTESMDPDQEIAALRLHVERLKEERATFEDDLIEQRRQLRKVEEKTVEAARVRGRLEKIIGFTYELNSPVQQLLSMMELEANKKYKTQLTIIAGILQQIRETEGLESGAGAPTIASVEDGLAPCAEKRIMIVDDEEPIRDLFGRILADALPELELDFAENGQRGVDLFETQHHCVIVMDIAMPTMNGEVAFIETQRVCRERMWRMPAVIFCTGFAPPQAIRNLRMGDGHCYVPKPVTSATLIQAVRERLPRKPPG